MEPEFAKPLALQLALLCVRNTSIENIHAGKTPATDTGDYSDVKVVTPRGEIAWTELSRISDDEMRRFMKEVVNKIYTVLLRLGDPEFLERIDQYTRQCAGRWDEPENLVNWFTGKTK